MLGLFALLALTQLPASPCGPEGPIFCTGASTPVFEFAPVSGAGMPTECAGVNPNGSKGENLTFSRTSSATCIIGNTINITSGSMVTLPVNNARVMRGGDGTGTKGILIEGGRTNSTLRSQEFDNAAWTKFGDVTAPTVTADQAVAPDGTTTADRVQFAATSGANRSIVFDTGASCPISADSASIFVKGNGGSGTLDLYVQTPATRADCNYVAGSWTRCTVTGTLTGGGNIAFGNNSLISGSSRSAADVFVWGAQCEAGPFTSSYISTTAAAGTRISEAASLPLALSNATGSFFATVLVPYTYTDADHAIAALSTPGQYQHLLDARQAASQTTFYSFAGGGISVAPTLGGNTEARIGGYWAGPSNVTVAFNTSFQAGAWVATTPTTLVELGEYSGGTSHLFGVVKKVCVDTTTGGCR
jgi:hypothetical protein